MKKSVIVVVCLLLVGIFGWSIAKANSADIKVHLGARNHRYGSTRAGINS